MRGSRTSSPPVRRRRIDRAAVVCSRSTPAAARRRYTRVSASRAVPRCSSTSARSRPRCPRVRIGSTAVRGRRIGARRRLSRRRTGPTTPAPTTCGLVTPLATATARTTPTPRTPTSSRPTRARARTYPRAGRPSVEQLRGAEWRFAVTDDEGHLLLAGVTRHRPSGLLAVVQSVGRCRGGIVELQVSAAQLDRLAERSGPGWAGVVTDIAARYANRQAVLAGLDERPDDRFPVAALARHIQVRDRTCRTPAAGGRPAAATWTTPRPRPRRDDGQGEPGPALCPPPPVQTRAGLATRPAPPGNLRMDQPARAGLPDPRRADLPTTARAPTSSGRTT